VVARKSMNVRLRRSKAEPAFAGMTSGEMALKSLDPRLRGDDVLEGDVLARRRSG
jgi:hypothetical protein